MKNRLALAATIFLLVGILSLTGCTAEFAQQMVEAAAIGVAQGTVLGLTDNPELAAQAGQEMQESFDRQRQAAIKKELLAALPVEWRREGSELYQDDSGNWNYVHPDQQIWYKHNGTMWVDPDASNQVMASAAPEPRPAPQMKATPVKMSEGEEKTATIADARKAKKDQELQGRMFQNSSTKAWFLEDQEGATYKLKNGVFVKL